MIYCAKSNQDHYPFVLPTLPYEKESFMPHFSAETFDYHHGKHHQAYVTNLNNLLANDSKYHDIDLENLIIKAEKNNDFAIFNNAAQVWNHSFFWHSIKPLSSDSKPLAKTMEYISKDFGNFANFADELKQNAISQFGSGWAWLVLADNKLEVIKTTNANTPITKGLQPLIALDVWEHAYYIDYRNKRPDYVSTFIEKLINWPRVEAIIARALNDII